MLLNTSLDPNTSRLNNQHKAVNLWVVPGVQEREMCGVLRQKREKQM